VLLLTISVIVITLVVQGFTLAPLVRRAGVAISSDDARQEQAATRLLLARTGLAHLDGLTQAEVVPEVVIDQLRASWKARIDRIQAHKSPEATEPPSALAYRQLRRHLIAVENAELNRLYESGMVTDATRRRIQRLLDLEHAALTDDEF
jgi:NhaP-type Na+/H+ or K+/H+ antiporter